MVSRLIHTFNIEPVLDNTGKPIIPELEDYKFGIVLTPPKIEAKFTVRSERISNLLEKEFVETAKEGKLDSWQLGE